MPGSDNVKDCTIRKILLKNKTTIFLCTIALISYILFVTYHYGGMSTTLPDSFDKVQLFLLAMFCVPVGFSLLKIFYKIREEKLAFTPFGIEHK